MMTMQSLNARPVLKPLPRSIEDFKKELQSIQNLHQNSQSPTRAKLCYYVISSQKIKRSSQSAMILLVGASGVGKSCTINHLFDTGEQDPVALTSHIESKTKATSEYVLTVDEPSLEVCDLNMSVIDTPGLNDTVGVNQDACNFMSIKKFFETHPSLCETIYPNLIFLMVSAMDQRLKGPNSYLAKCLRGIKMLEVVDKNHPNVVAVITFCCSVGHKNVEKWEKKMEEKKRVISDTVFEVLGVQAPVVLMENGYDDEHELQRVGDFTLLPNNEKQPKNLYDACLKLLQQNQDHFGLVVLNASFERAKKDRPKNGHKVEAKDSRVEKLSEKEKQFSATFSETAKGDPLAMRAMEYITEKDLDKSQQDEVMKLVESMNSLGLSDEVKLQSVTIGEINYVHGGEISEHGIEMLEQKFGIKSEIVPIQSAELLGKGYDIIADTPVSAEIMKFLAVDHKKFGFKVPGCAQIAKVNETRKFNMDFKDEESEMKTKLNNLGLNVQLAPLILKMAPQFGASTSRKKDSSVKSTKTTKSSLLEYRMVKISIELKSEGIQFTNDFSSAVKELPDRYTYEERNKREFTKFFARFGHYVVTSAYVGGAVETKKCRESVERSEPDEKSRGVSAGAKVPGVVEFKVSGKSNPSTESTKNAVFNTAEINWRGGRSDLQTDNTLKSEEKLLAWKASLAKDPVLLKTQMRLEPISSVVAIIDERKFDACYQALRNRFGNNDIRPVLNRQDQHLKVKKEIEDDQERRRRASNLRAGSTKEPDTGRWWERVVEFFDDLLDFMGDVFDDFFD